MRDRSKTERRATLVAKFLLLLSVESGQIEKRDSNKYRRGFRQCDHEYVLVGLPVGEACNSKQRDHGSIVRQCIHAAARYGRDTKDALAAAKRRGVTLGGDRGVKPSAKTLAKALAAIEARASARAADIGPTIAELQASGVTSLRAIAAALNQRGIPTARGDGEWSATQVMRVLDRLAP
jgi:hypothetical protein